MPESAVTVTANFSQNLGDAYEGYTLVTIRDQADFASFVAASQNTNNTYQGVQVVENANVYVLLCDDLANITGQIGTSASTTTDALSFNGVFDGNDKTIQKLTVPDNASNSTGFISVAAPGAVVQNITFTNCTNAQTAASTTAAAIVIGNCEASAGTITLNKVTVTGSSVTASNAVGVLVGNNNTNSCALSISNCIVQNNELTTTKSTGVKVGALVGYAKNSGNITQASNNVSGNTWIYKDTANSVTEYSQSAPADVCTNTVTATTP